MQYIWEVSDFERHDKFRAAGMIIGTCNVSEKYMIGYLVGPDDGRKKWTMNSLSDGMVLGPYSAEELVAMLNKGKSIPLHSPVRLIDMWKGELP